MRQNPLRIVVCRRVDETRSRRKKVEKTENRNCLFHPHGQGRNHGLVIEVGGLVHGERVAQAYNGGLGAGPLVGSRSGGFAPLELTSFRHTRHIFCNEICNKFANSVKIGYINQVDVDSLHITMQLILIDLVWM